MVTSLLRLLVLLILTSWYKEVYHIDPSSSVRIPWMNILAYLIIDEEKNIDNRIPFTRQGEHGTEIKGW